MNSKAESCYILHTNIATLKYLILLITLLEIHIFQKLSRISPGLVFGWKTSKEFEAMMQRWALTTSPLNIACLENPEVTISQP